MFDASVPFMKTLVTILVKCKKPVMLHGAPGIAKSAALKQICAYLTKETEGKSVHKLYDCRLSQKEPTDLGGLPFAQDGFTAYLPPKFMPREGFGILFLDEANRAERPTQQAAFQLVYDRQFGEYILPKNIAIVLAGNLGDDDMSIVNEWDAPFCNRLFHIRVTALQKDWEKYMANRTSEYTDDMENFTWVENPERVDLVVKFLRGHETHFMGKQCIGAFPTPRTWEMLEEVIEHIGGYEADPILVNAFAVACVGEAAGIAFTKWFREREEFKPTLIVDDYSKAIKAKFMKLSGGYKTELYESIAEYINKMPKFTEKQKKNIIDFVFDVEIVPEEKAVTMMTVWCNNATVIGVLQSVGTKFLSYFKKVKNTPKP
jgi:hypothetical protein